MSYNCSLFIIHAYIFVSFEFSLYLMQHYRVINIGYRLYVKGLQIIYLQALIC